MLRMHKEQMAAFEARAAELFPARLQALLLAKLPEQSDALEGTEGRERIAHRIERAREHGFVGERDIAQFVALTFVLREHFDGEPWAKEVLSDETLETPTDRMEALWARAEQQALDDATSSMATGLSGNSGSKTSSMRKGG